MIDHLETLLGHTVVDWKAGDALPAGAIPRLALDYDDYEKKKSWTDAFQEFLEAVDTGPLAGLVVGAYDFESSQDSAFIVEAIVAARERFPALRALFIGDITSEENEISWIQQSDLSPLFAAFPDLEYLGVRGGDGLILGSPHHAQLKTLVVESGGLDGGVVRGLCEADLPALEHLELYLGTENYGGTVSVEDLRPILEGKLFPALHYLGLRDAEIADDVARAVANAPILQRIETLDLSLGMLGDEGAQALLDSSLVRKLRKLDLHYHFCTDAMQEKLRELPLEVDVSDAQSGDEWKGEIYRYVAVNE